ncbi:hypothetical protein J6TS7_32320 [Paenibacillus dendritiformis]|nr:hypothetical protein J6TS7_32320 [Paenibacillus dendritiformis]
MLYRRKNNQERELQIRRAAGRCRLPIAPNRRSRNTVTQSTTLFLSYHFIFSEQDAVEVTRQREPSLKKNEKKMGRETPPPLIRKRSG